ncbi:MAG: putative toxin-antitoxin system toxin component, PIN family [Acidimicrobiales bacterium]
MTTGRTGAPRVVVDAGVFVSAAISGRGAPAQLLDFAVEGRLTLLISPQLLTELRDVLGRDKIRRYITPEEADNFLEAVATIAERVDDPVEYGRIPVCRDPDDDYLVALAEATDATFLVSGDRDLLEVDRPGLDVRSPRDAVEAIIYHHPWGHALVTGDESVAWSQAQVEGHANVLQTVAAFLEALEEDNAVEVLPYIVTPESRAAWAKDIPAVRNMARDRGIATRVDYPSPNLAYVKLPPDPGDTIKATGHVLLEDAIIVTLQRRPELPDSLRLGGWRVHGIGAYVPSDEMPSPRVEG